MHQDIIHYLRVPVDQYNNLRFPHVHQKYQEIRANGHETRDSISLVLRARCPGLSPIISAKIHSLKFQMCVAA